MPFDEILRPSDIGLILSYQCSSRCAHCVYNCSVERKEWMDAADVRSALTTLLDEYGHSFQVHLTGGEVFLNYPLLLEATRISAGLDIPVYLETNASWCTEPGRTLQRFGELQQAGLQAVLISCSPFHAEYIPLKRTLQAIDAGWQVFGRKRTMVYLPDWVERIGQMDIEKTVPLQRWAELYGLETTRRMFWDSYGLIAGGRSGYRLGSYASKQPAEAFRGETCRYELLYAAHSHVDLYGSFVPAFCGGIRLGSWRRLSELRAILEAGMYPPLIEKLVDSGPFGLYEFARHEHGYSELAGGYAGRCHLCVDVRRHIHAVGGFEELGPEGFYQGLDV